MEPQDQIILRCVKEGNKLRIKIVSAGYSQQANCQFPRDIRVDGREYTVPKCDVVMSDTKGKFFYRVKKNNIKVLEKSFKDLKVYGDENLQECAVCLIDIDTDPNICFVILVPCGHYALCDRCAYTCKEKGTCPLCRGQITQIITKDQLQ